MLREKMAEGLKRVVEKNEAMVVMCFDLDNFKAINNSLGHPFGDKLLQSMADRLSNVVGKNDTLARLGGDEFAILHPTTNPQDAEKLARRLLNATNNPFVIDGQEINSSICIGIAVALQTARPATVRMRGSRALSGEGARPQQFTFL